MKAAAFASKLKQGIADVSTKRAETLGRRRLLSAGGRLYITSPSPDTSPLQMDSTGCTDEKRRGVQLPVTLDCPAWISPSLAPANPFSISFWEASSWRKKGSDLIMPQELQHTSCHNWDAFSHVKQNPNLNADHLVTIPAIFLYGRRKVRGAFPCQNCFLGIKMTATSTGLLFSIITYMNKSMRMSVYLGYMEDAEFKCQSNTYLFLNFFHLPSFKLSCIIGSWAVRGTLWQKCLRGSCVFPLISWEKSPINQSPLNWDVTIRRKNLSSALY